MVKKLPSGAELDITIANWSDAHNLFKVFLREVGIQGSKFELVQKMLSSEEVDRAVWPCLKMCTYQKVRISPDLFDESPNAREDFLAIVKEVIDFNLSPFFKNLSSVS